MHSAIYQDLIDNKVAEWRKNLAEIGERASKGGKDVEEKIAVLDKKISDAENALHQLDEQERLDNTVKIKNEILAIFDIIDREFKAFVETAPFML